MGLSNQRFKTLNSHAMAELYAAKASEWQFNIVAVVLYTFA